MELLNTLHEKIDRLLGIPDRVERGIQAIHGLIEGMKVMSQAQDRFTAKFAEFKSEFEKSKADNRAKIKDLEDRLAAAQKPDTSATDKVFSDASDDFDKLIGELAGPDSSTSSAGGSDASPPSSKPPAGTINGASDSFGSDTPQPANLPAPGGTPADALSSGSAGTGSPSPSGPAVIS